MQTLVFSRSFKSVFFRHLQDDGTFWAKCSAWHVGVLDVLLSQSCAAGECALLRKRGQIERAQKALLREVEDSDKYNVSQ